MKYFDCSDILISVTEFLFIINPKMNPSVNEDLKHSENLNFM